MTAADRDDDLARESMGRSTATTLASYLATAALTAVLTLFLVRTLGPEQFGIFTLAMGIGALASIAVDFGIAPSLARYLAEHRHDRAALAQLFATATRLKLVLAGAVGVVLCLLAGPIAAAYDTPAAAWAIRGVAIATVLQSLMMQFSSAFLALGRASTNLRLVLGESAVELSVSVGLVLLGGGAAAAAFGRAVGYAAGAVIGLAFAVRLLGRAAARLRPDRSAARPMARLSHYAAWVWLVNGTYVAFGQVNVLVIGGVLGPAAVGAYGAPARLIVLLSYPGLALANTIAPRVARGTDLPPDGELLDRALRGLLLVQALLVPPLLLWAQPIVDVALGGDYGESVPVLQFLAPFVYMQGIAALLSLTINFLGEAKRRLVYTVLALVINLAFTATLLSTLGLEAAAIGSSLAFAVFTLGHLLIARRLTGLRLRPLVPTVLRSAVAAAAMAGVLWSFGTSELTALDWLAGSVLSALAYLTVLVVLRELSVAQLRALVAALRGGLR